MRIRFCLNHEMDLDIDKYSINVLKYSIESSSSFSGTYTPDKILEDCPHEQGSRWSSDSNSPPQFLILKLLEPAVIRQITFGKYEKTHVCNVKRFRIHGGSSPEHMTLLLESGLKNDTNHETFDLKFCVENHPVAYSYIKIEPLLSHGPNFNFSIWFVELKGHNDPILVFTCLQWHQQHRENQTIRLCLKHFRQHNYLSAFEALSKKTRVQLEHPILSQLHEALVQKGDFEKAESILYEASIDHIFQSYIKSRNVRPVWENISPVSYQPGDEKSNLLSCESRPGMRGGHQMVLDPTVGQSCIYLFGGWDGKRDLADLWRFDISLGVWTCLSWDTSRQAGPSARSCHKMCFDPLRRQIFTLGRYIDSALRRDPSIMRNDFYVFDVAGNSWTLITEDTEAMGGPCLIFDHQIVIDALHSTIYVFGGRELRPDSTNDEGNSFIGGVPSPHRYSGLYSYNVPTGTWCLLRADGPQLVSRMGHSMLFHAATRQLYILAGQRAKEYRNDFLRYDVDKDVVTVIVDGRQSSSDGHEIPAAGFTQRATIDPDHNEIYVLSGLSKEKDKRDNVRNSFWVYSILRNTWTCVYRNDESCAAGATAADGSDLSTNPLYASISEPVPRYAHQLVYDPIRKLHFLFGGNPGRGQPGLSQPRLDDLWSLTLVRPSTDELLRRCRYLLRRQRFKELAIGCSSTSAGFEALHFLQQSVADVVDHSNSDERRRYEALAGWLFMPLTSTYPPYSKLIVTGDSGALMESEEEYLDDPTCLPLQQIQLAEVRPCVESELYEGSENKHHYARSQLFDTLTRFFPSEMAPPRDNLIDLIPM